MTLTLALLLTFASLFSVFDFCAPLVLPAQSNSYAVQNGFSYETGSPTEPTNLMLHQRSHVAVYPYGGGFFDLMGLGASSFRLIVRREYAKDITPLPAACAIADPYNPTYGKTYVTGVASYVSSTQMNFNFTLYAYTVSTQTVGAEEPTSTYEYGTIFECSNPYQSTYKERWLMNVQYLHPTFGWSDLSGRVGVNIRQIDNNGNYSVNNMSAHTPHPVVFPATPPVSTFAQLSADLYIWNNSTYVFYKKTLYEAASPLSGYGAFDNPKTVNGQPSIVAIYVTGCHTGSSFASSFVPQASVDGTDYSSNFVTGFAESGYYGTQQINWKIPQNMTEANKLSIDVVHTGTGPLAGGTVVRQGPQVIIPHLVP